MIAKMRAPEDGGSRIAIVFNGSLLFTGDAGGGESEIRRWIIENDWLEAIVALPEQLFYNTGISTYLWVLTNRKEKPRKAKVQLIDARPFWVPMEKSLGNKRRRIGDLSDKEKDPDHIGDLTRLFGDFKDGETRSFTEEDPITHQPIQRQRVVSKIFSTEDFGYHKITVERPLRLALEITDEKLQLLATGQTGSAKLDRQPREVLEHVVEQLRPKARPGRVMSRDAFDDWLKHALPVDKFITKSLRLLLREAFAERDETAEICLDAKGQPEPDADLRDTETVPLKERIDLYFKREVLPHVPDAWIDTGKTKVGYEIPLNRHFYRYEPPRELEVIETDIKTLEDQIVTLLKEVTA
jgi:type I restriction enzyme M protein